MPESFPTKFDGPEESPGFLLWQVTNAWQREIRTVLEAVDLTHVQFVLLASLGWLSREGRAVNQVELSRHAKADVMMTSKVVRSLEARGLIGRVPNVSDSRAMCLTLTESGRDLVALAIPIVEESDAKFFLPLGDSGEGFLTALRRLVEIRKT